MSVIQTVKSVKSIHISTFWTLYMPLGAISTGAYCIMFETSKWIYVYSLNVCVLHAFFTAQKFMHGKVEDEKKKRSNGKFLFHFWSFIQWNATHTHTHIFRYTCTTTKWYHHGQCIPCLNLLMHGNPNSSNYGNRGYSSMLQHYHQLKFQFYIHLIHLCECACVLQMIEISFFLSAVLILCRSCIWHMKLICKFLWSRMRSIYCTIKLTSLPEWISNLLSIGLKPFVKLYNYYIHWEIQTP